MRGRFRVGANEGARLAKTRVKRMTVVTVLLFGGLATVVLGKWTSYGAASVYGIAVFSVLAVKLTLSLSPPRKWPSPNRRQRVGVIVTLYNEDPELLRQCLDSLLAQTFEPAAILIVDDHSRDQEAYELARMYARWDRRIRVCRQPVNRGKREALGVGMRSLEGEADVFLCVDSDSRLEPNAIYEGMRPFRVRKIMAVTGIVLPSNHTASVVTRFQDVRYVNSFIGERAAYSQFGSVLCVCGALAFYRASAALKHLDAFLGQTFLGRPATVGDDRHMTNLLLTQGRVVLAENCISHTAVPVKPGHYVRQQARWGRSFFRESLWALCNLRPTKIAWWLTLLEIAQWFIFSTILLYVLIVHPIIAGEFLIMQYLVFVGFMATARSVRYFDLRRDDQPVRSRLATFATAPLYGYVSLLVLLPLRLYSLATLRTAKWGTRKKVEVTAASPATASEFIPPTAHHEREGALAA